ncbi:MAG: hypothetical protein EOP08_13600, partial [Proteobacteria bacterium]
MNEPVSPPTQQTASARTSLPLGFGRYRVLSRLGSGGMASVYLARDGQAGELVAIKALHPFVLEQPDLQRDFLREASIARRIEHPNVVRVGEGSIHEGVPYLVMEHVDGETLGALMRRVEARGGPMPLAVSLRIAVDVLHGLHAAHELTGLPVSCKIHGGHAAAPQARQHTIPTEAER